jgi:hypothetical protein
MFLSRKTIEAHVSQIFMKLDLRLDHMARAYRVPSALAGSLTSSNRSLPPSNDQRAVINVPSMKVNSIRSR